MTLKSTLLAAMAIFSIASVGCKTQKADVTTSATPIATTHTSTPATFMPEAQIYRMNGNWSQYVPVGVNPARTALTSFPAPSDISAAQAPVKLADGWWLDRRGIGPNSAFTSYTYEQYAALPAAPKPSELLNSLLPGAEITEIVALPMKTSEAAADIPAVNRLIADGLPNCKISYKK